MSYPYQPPIIIPQAAPREDGSSAWIGVVVGLIFLFVIGVILYATLNTSNTSKDSKPSTDSSLDCPKKLSSTDLTKCLWKRTEATNTRCLSEDSSTCTEEIAKKECAILGKWSALDSKKYVCIFYSAKEKDFTDKPIVEKPSTETSTESSAPSSSSSNGSSSKCQIFGSCTSSEYENNSECTITESGVKLKCTRNCPPGIGIVNNGGCWSQY